MSTILKLLGIMGVLLFGGLFSLTLVSPEIVENSAKGFVKTQIEKEVRGKRLAMSDASVTDAALKVAAKLGLEKEKIQADLDAKLPDKIASIIAAMCGYDCEKNRAVSESLASSYMDRIKNIQVAEATLNDVVKGKYLEIVGNLQLDLRIFLESVQNSVSANFGHIALNVYLRIPICQFLVRFQSLTTVNCLDVFRTQSKVKIDKIEIHALLFWEFLTH